MSAKEAATKGVYPMEMLSPMMRTFFSVVEGGRGAPGLQLQRLVPKDTPEPGSTQLYVVCKSVKFPLPLASTHSVVEGQL